MSQRIQHIIVAAVVLLLLGGGYLYLTSTSKPSEEGGLTVDGRQNLAAVGDQEILRLLQELKAISLETNLFSSPVFQSLEDFGVVLDPQPKGRTNPFAPIGVESAPSPSTPASDNTDTESDS